MLFYTDCYYSLLPSATIANVLPFPLLLSPCFFSQRSNLRSTFGNGEALSTMSCNKSYNGEGIKYTIVIIIIIFRLPYINLSLSTRRRFYNAYVHVFEFQIILCCTLLFPYSKYTNERETHTPMSIITNKQWDCNRMRKGTVLNVIQTFSRRRHAIRLGVKGVLLLLLLLLHAWGFIPKFVKVTESA